MVIVNENFARTYLPDVHPLGRRLRVGDRNVGTRVHPGAGATQEQLRDQRIAQEHFFAYLCGALAGLALLLCCVCL